jgi:protein dithiol:quinone oxidoreductase
MIPKILSDWLDNSPRAIFLWVVAACVGMLGFGQYLQHSLGIDPCPMCIVQRYATVLVAIFAAVAAATGKRSMHVGGGFLMLLSAGFGAYVAARQSWLQWYPPEVVSCGRDFYGMIETFPLQRAIPMIFKGSGDCSKVDWTFLGGSIANWTFLCFSGFTLLAVLLIARRVRQSAVS